MKHIRKQLKLLTELALSEDPFKRRLLKEDA